MKEEQRKFLSQQLRISQEFQNHFFEFRQNARTQLLSNQLQYFQSIAGISLAVIGVLLATGSVAVSLWWILTGVVALLLVVYASTHTREANDSWDKGLNHEEKSLKQAHQDLEKVISQAIQADDFSTYESHVLSKGSQTSVEPRPSYAGEIAVFLFLLTIFFGTVAFISEYIHVGILSALLFASGGIFLCFAVSMGDWNLAMTERVSYFLGRILKKPIS